MLPSGEMLELHRYKHVDWKPSPVVALAASIDGTAIAAGRGNGSIEIWIVSPGSVGWHCELTIPGKKDASLSCLLWCPSRCSKRGRLFSAGLDGLIAEWDLATLQIKEVLKSYGGSVWQMALEPSHTVTGLEGVSGSRSPEQSSSLSTDGNSDSDDDENVSVSDDEQVLQGELKVAVGCDDGCVRLFTVSDGDTFIYKKSFPRVQGRILSVSWSTDAGRVFSGGSDGCIRCWDVKQFRELYRITAGLGGAGNGSTFCIWSILALRDGTIVSGDSSGSTQFWDGKQGTLLQVHTGHRADVLALAAAPSHQSVFAAGADGQVVQYQLVSESKVLADAARKGVDVGLGFGARWVFVGSKRTHTHDVNALVVAFPPVSDHTAEPDSKAKLVKERKKLKRSWMELDQAKSAQVGVISMLVSGGNDAKLLTYPANAFLAFHPHDICFAPQRTPVTLALGSKLQSGLIMMAQHEHKVELWKITINGLGTSRQALPSSSGSTQNTSSPLGKRKLQESSEHKSKKRMANGHAKKGKARVGNLCNGPSSESPVPCSLSHTGKIKGSPPELLARIKCKSIENITCSAISDTGQYVAISDQSQPRLYELEQRCAAGTNGAETWAIKKRELPHDIPPAHSMVFCRSSRLLLATQGNAVWVVDTASATILHQFVVERDTQQQDEKGPSPLTSMCTSSDQRWLAAANSRGNISVFDLQTFRLHWNVPTLDGNYATATCFHPRNSDTLLVATNSNVLYILDVNRRKLGDWSKNNSHRLPRSFLEFPGGVQGLSVCPSLKGTIAVAYSSKAMCLIDFQKPVPQDNFSSVLGLKKSHLSHGAPVSNEKAALQNGGSNPPEKNFVLVPFKDPVLFAGYVSDTSLLVVEKPWLEALNQLPPPVYRHLYGT